jgi:hypothetical protein
LFNSALEGRIVNPATGQWSIAVPAGDYKVIASGWVNGKETPLQYYNNAQSFEAAATVTSAGSGTVSGIDFNLTSQGGSVQGAVSYGGGKTGDVICWISPNSGNDWPALNGVVGGFGQGGYSLSAPVGTWHVKCFMDMNYNVNYDPGEPFGEYSGSVYVTNGGIVTGANIVLSDTLPAPSRKIFWRNVNSGAVAIWHMTGTSQTGFSDVGAAPAGWSISGVGDFSADNLADILWREASTGMVAIWTTDGVTQTGFAYVDGAPMVWQIVGVGDFNADGKTDLLWRNMSTGQVVIWTMNGLSNVGFALVESAPLSWEIVGVGDFNGDGKPDILWQNTSSGLIVVWFMDGVVQVGYGEIGTAPVNGKIGGSGDFTGDGKPDIIWRDTATGAVTLWPMNGIIQNGTMDMGSAPLDWQISGVF